MKQRLIRLLHPTRLLNSFFHSVEWQVGRRRFPILNDNAVPWFTTACLRWLVTLDLKDKRIIEYGGGYSTIWFARNGARVDCFERDTAWREKILELAGDDKDHIRFIDEADGIYDIAVVDVHHRPTHLRLALNHTPDDGLIIFDDSAWYPKLFGTFNGLLAFHFWGWAAGYHGIKCTSVIVRNERFSQRFEAWENRTVSDDDIEFST